MQLVVAVEVIEGRPAPVTVVCVPELWPTSLNWHQYAERGPVSPNEPVDLVRLSDATRYPGRLNLASALVTLQQEGS